MLRPPVPCSPYKSDGSNGDQQHHCNGTFFDLPHGLTQIGVGQPSLAHPAVTVAVAHVAVGGMLARDRGDPVFRRCLPSASLWHRPALRAEDKALTPQGHMAAIPSPPPVTVALLAAWVVLCAGLRIPDSHRPDVESTGPELVGYSYLGPIPLSSSIAVEELRPKEHLLALTGVFGELLLGQPKWITSVPDSIVDVWEYGDGVRMLEPPIRLVGQLSINGHHLGPEYYALDIEGRCLTDIVQEKQRSDIFSLAGTFPVFPCHVRAFSGLDSEAAVSQPGPLIQAHRSHHFTGLSSLFLGGSGILSRNEGNDDCRHGKHASAPLRIGTCTFP